MFSGRIEVEHLVKTSIMVLFEIHQRFKGHFFNELRVSFNPKRNWQLFRLKKRAIRQQSDPWIFNVFQTKTIMEVGNIIKAAT